MISWRSESTGTCLIASCWPDSLCMALYTAPYALTNTTNKTIIMLAGYYYQYYNTLLRFSPANRTLPPAVSSSSPRWAWPVVSCPPWLILTLLYTINYYPCCSYKTSLGISFTINNYLLSCYWWRHHRDCRWQSHDSAEYKLQEARRWLWRNMICTVKRRKQRIKFSTRWLNCHYKTRFHL